MLRARLVTPILALALGACATAPSQPAAGAMPELPKPTAEHKWLQQGLGTWEGTLTHFVPGEEPHSVAAKEVVEALGDFWTQSRFSCDFQGTPFKGAGTMGYDPAKKKIVGTWIDSFSDSMSIMEGEFTQSGKGMVARFDAPDMNGKIQPHRIETTFGNDAYTSTFYVGEGAGTKSMVIEMHRAKSATR